MCGGGSKFRKARGDRERPVKTQKRQPYLLEHRVDWPVVLPPPEAQRLKAVECGPVDEWVEHREVQRHL